MAGLNSRKFKSLCGHNGAETELDMSDMGIGAAGAIMLAPEIVANGALTSLDISNNSLGGYYEGFGGGRKWISGMSGVKALAAAIPECK